jgi:hypothetical protein
MTASPLALMAIARMMPSPVQHDLTPPKRTHTASEHMETFSALCQAIAAKYDFQLTGLAPAPKHGEVLRVRFLQQDKLCLEFELDSGHHKARLEDFQVSYSSVSQVYSWKQDQQQGQVDQYSPFDDGPGWPTRFSVEEWSERILRYYLEFRGIGRVY